MGPYKRSKFKCLKFRFDGSYIFLGSDFLKNVFSLID